MINSSNIIDQNIFKECDPKKLTKPDKSVWEVVKTHTHTHTHTYLYHTSIDMVSVKNNKISKTISILLWYRYGFLEVSLKKTT